MNKSLIIIIAIMLSLSASAQRKGRKVQEPVVKITPQEAMAAYDFAQAEEILERQIEDLRKKCLNPFACRKSSCVQQSK